jgi:membrane protease YdiL (CAAX protease family)
MRKNLVGRFRILYLLELLNAVIVFPGLVLLMSRNVHIGVFTILAAAFVSFLLFVGAGFSFLKYRDLQNGTQNLSRHAQFFHWLRRFIPVVLLAGFLVFFIQFQSVDVSTQIPDLLLGLLLYALAILEYINYFHVQLMYDNRHDLAYLFTMRKLKRGLIAREFNW